jgi:hypothetical protein
MLGKRSLDWQSRYFGGYYRGGEHEALLDAVRIHTVRTWLDSA